jgi:hypothetical protein
MDKDKAQQILKAALDMATKAGIFQNIDAAAMTAQAWAYIQQLLKNDEPK